MNFAYDGFTQEENQRCFLFRCTDERPSVTIFSIQVDLKLLLEHKVPIQSGPMFCLKLLTDASRLEPNGLDRLHSYTLVAADFKELHTERQREAEQKLSKKPHRHPVRKPSQMSNLHLGPVSSRLPANTHTEEPGQRILAR
jgi:hypothetical protein